METLQTSCIVNLDKGEIEDTQKTAVDEIDDYKVEITLEEAIERAMLDLSRRYICGSY